MTWIRWPWSRPPSPSQTPPELPPQSFWERLRNHLAHIGERFGVNAGKTMSDQLADPLDRLARSPVMQTGEINVIHHMELGPQEIGRVAMIGGGLILFNQAARLALERTVRSRL